MRHITHSIPASQKQNQQIIKLTQLIFQNLQPAQTN